ncbi:ROK family protein [Auraticoccus cholistanensis]|nr:ROK family protein [Auraticoccus cholistanensis]
MRHISGVVTPGQLLAIIIEHPHLTRAQLLELTGISRTTLLSRVEALFSLDLLVEEPSGGTGRPGRPAGQLRVKDVERTVLVADLGSTQAQLAVTTAAGEVLVTEAYDHDITDGPDVVLAEALDRLERMLADSGRGADTLCGMGLAVPGPVSPTTRRVTRSTWLSSWNDVDLTALVQRRWPVPLLVDNDANVMAVGEVELSGSDAHASVLLKVGNGVGAGLVVDGELYHGGASLEGELEHIRVDGSDRVCDCGRTGCLSALVSGRALAALLREDGLDAPNPRAVAAHVRDGNALARRLVTEGGVALGRALATAVALLDPERVMVGGDLSDTDEVLTDAIREGLRWALHTPMHRDIEVWTSSQDGRSAIRGALRMVRAAVFSPDAVDAALGERDAAPGG